MMITGTLLLAVIYSIISLAAVVEANNKGDSITTISNLDDLPYDENDHLSTHIFAYPSGKCASLLKDGNVVQFDDGDFGHQWIGLDGEAFNSVFGHHLEEGSAQLLFTNDDDDDKITNFNKDCVAVCLEKGTLRNIVARPLPHRYFIHGNVDQDGDGRKIDETTVQQFFMSDSCAKVSVFYGHNLLLLCTSLQTR